MKKRLYKKRKNKFLLGFSVLSLLIGAAPISQAIADINNTLTRDEIAKQLGWTVDTHNRCGGYYIESPFLYPDKLVQDHLVQITSSGPALFSQHGTSIFQGKVTVTRLGQEIIANQAFLYRDPQTNKITAVDLIGNVNLREPNSLVVAKKAHLNMATKNQSLNDISYRTTIYSHNQRRPTTPLVNDTLQKPREIHQLSAWGEAREFTQDHPKIYFFQQASYSTCPPETNVWQVNANTIELNKNTGRGTARNARLYLKNIPVFYTPYLNFPIDARRQTGFLFPYFGNKDGPYVATPFYWNLAPNYDTTITPMYFSKRGLEVTDLFRYLTPITHGKANISILPDDKAFSHFQTVSAAQYQSNPDMTVQANLRRLENAGSTRGALSFENNAQFNQHWSSDIDFNYVTDDFYLRDIKHSLNEVTTNQLLQQGDINYKGPHWNFTGRIQQYQTLHPVDEVTVFDNQYSRLPQLILEGDYPNQPGGLDYFVSNDITHFDIRNTPGTTLQKPIGNRLNTLPGVSLPLNWPYLYITPRIQFALTDYELTRGMDVFPKNINRSLPIFDVGSGMYFDRHLKLFGYALQQTLEPQIYYTYIPYRNQDNIPIFDTTLNTLTYDQLFTYNRFSGLDRIGDANQISLGVTTRFLNDNSGEEKIRLGLGEIVYFKDRRVTLCSLDNINCPDDKTISDNQQRRSPLSGTLNVSLIPFWTLTGNTIWNTQINAVDNQSVALQYSTNAQHIVNVGYNFVRNGDVLPTDPIGSGMNNLKQVDISFAWPFVENWGVVGRWTKNINRGHLQNLLYGLQYDSCCWAVRFVAAKTFTKLNADAIPDYSNEFYIQFALKGLGNFGFSDPTQLLSSSVPGYNTEFGQDF